MPSIFKTYLSGEKFPCVTQSSNLAGFSSKLTDADWHNSLLGDAVINSYLSSPAQVADVAELDKINKTRANFWFFLNIEFLKDKNLKCFTIRLANLHPD